MVRPIRRPAHYYEHWAQNLSPAARMIWDGLPEEGNRHWLARAAEHGDDLDDPDLALVVGELQTRLLDRGATWVASATVLVLFSAGAWIVGEWTVLAGGIGSVVGLTIGSSRRNRRLVGASERNLQRGLQPDG